MKTDPNNLPVENDTLPDSTSKPPGEKAIENGEPIETAPIETAGPIESDNQPVIPSGADLDPHKPAAFNDAANNGADPDAPYGRNKDGTPAKKRGRKAPGETTAGQFDRLDSVTPADRLPRPSVARAQIAVINTDYRALSHTAANLWFNVPQIAFGAEWAPESIEVPIIAKGFEDYFRAKNVNSIDPTLSLCLVLGSYTVARFNKPTISSKVQLAGAWIKSKFSWRRKPKGVPE